MPAENDKIEVSVLGAVIRDGHHSLMKPATIRMALDAANGLQTQLPKMTPSGVVTVRRIKAKRNVEVFRFTMSDTSADWEGFELQNSDFVIFQWHVELNE